VLEFFSLAAVLTKKTFSERKNFKIKTSRSIQADGHQRELNTLTRGVQNHWEPTLSSVMEDGTSHQRRISGSVTMPAAASMSPKTTIALFLGFNSAFSYLMPLC
jgi:hypothetical protein